MRVELPDNGDSLSLFCETIRQVPKLQEIFIDLVLCSLPSGFYNIVILNLLKNSQGEKKNTPEMMVLLSNLLRSEHEVESALIPKELAVSNLDVSDENRSNRSQSRRQTEFRSRDSPTQFAPIRTSWISQTWTSRSH